MVSIANPFARSISLLYIYIQKHTHTLRNKHTHTQTEKHKRKKSGLTSKFNFSSSDTKTFLNNKHVFFFSILEFVQR